MSDSDGKKTLGLRGTPRSGNVKQSFSHGRTKNVLVETKRKRVVVPKVGAPVQQGTNPAKTQSSNRPAGISDTEMARRLKAVQAAKAREAEDSATRAAEEENRQKERERRRENKQRKSANSVKLKKSCAKNLKKRPVCAKNSKSLRKKPLLMQNQPWQHPRPRMEARSNAPP